MSKLKVDQFVDLVKRSGLVDNERLNEALSGVDESVNDSGIIASILTKAGLLTEWHSEKLLQGRHKGFYLGKWKLLSHIGTGGMGSVYLAEHQVMRHRVAIKLLPNHLAAHPSYLERFHQEARASAKLNHPNMVKAHDVDHEGNVHFLVMDYVDGADLQAIVSRNGPLAYRVAAEYMRQASDGLAYAHRSGLIHRDIKPANLLVDKTNTVKILDMGLALFFKERRQVGAAAEPAGGCGQIAGVHVHRRDAGIGHVGDQADAGGDEAGILGRPEHGGRHLGGQPRRHLFRG